MRHVGAQVDDLAWLQREALAAALELEGSVETLHGDRVGRFVVRQRLAGAEVKDDEVRAVPLQQTLDPRPRVVWPRGDGVDRLDAGGVIRGVGRIGLAKYLGAIDGQVVFWLRHRWSNLWGSSYAVYFIGSVRKAWGAWADSSAGWV